MRATVRIGVVLCLTVVVVPAAGAADKEAIQRAVDRAVAYLKGLQGPDGTWGHRRVEWQPGATALCGLALLESGVPANDPVIEKAAKAVREAGVSTNQTYVLSLAIMFLDRLGDPADAELIDSLAVRLLAGQDANTGGWSYTCPPLNEAEVRRLQASLQQRRQLVARDAPPPAPKGRPSVQDLPQDIQQQLRLINQSQGAPMPLAVNSGDNSNTQFAVLALWIARRKGIPVETALRRIDARFRSTQQPDGGWVYQPPTPGVPTIAMGEVTGTRPAMTCAGLLGLALSHGSAMETTLRTAPAAAPGRGEPARDISKDPVVRKGLLALGSLIGKPLQLPATDPPANSTANPAGGGPVPQPGLVGSTGRGYYFLFSLERVAVAYGLETLGDTDWYNWGADILLKNQTQDGSWAGEFAEAGSDTCFALLFLRRANLAQDLSATLKGRVRDPGHELRAVDPATLGKGADPKAAAGDSDKGGTPKETRPAAAAVDPQVARLSDELVKADAGQQGEVLRKLRDSKGAVYTDALAHAIHRLDGAAKGPARDALADRLTRMTSTTLKDKLQDEDLEIRRAAALACAMKEEKAHVPRLIDMLEDPESDVARAAHAALKSLTNQDFGPSKDATRADVARAVAAWKEWWSKNGDK